MKEPRLRFKEFNDEWKSKPFKEIVKRTSKHDNDTNLPRVTFDDINNGLISSFTQSKQPGILFDKNDVLFGKLRPYLNNYWLANQDGIALGDFWVLRSKVGMFTFSLIQTSKYKYIANITSGTKMPRSDWSLVSNYCFNVPTSLAEQTKIGEFFNHLNKLIELQSSKLGHLERLRKGYLQKMFTGGDAIVPRLRFKEFNDDWKESSLKELGNIKAGGDVQKHKLKDNGTYPVLSNGLVNDGVIGYYDNYKINSPSITITGRGSIGVAKARNYKYTPVVRLLSFKTNLNIYFTENAINNINILNESTGVPQLTSVQLGKYRISYPSISEQTKIGDLFNKLDKLIELQLSKLEYLKQLKKGYLQKMFI